MADYGFAFDLSGSSAKLPNRVESSLTGAVAALRAYCVNGGDTNEKDLYDRIGAGIRENIKLPQEGVVLLLAAVEGMYRIRDCIDEYIPSTKYAGAMESATLNDRAWVLEKRTDREEALSKLRGLNNIEGKFEQARNQAENDFANNGVVCLDNAQAFVKPEDWSYIPNVLKQDCAGMIAYLEAVYKEFRSDEQQRAFYENLLIFPEFSAWLLSAMYTINLAHGCIWCVLNSKFELPATSDLLAEVFSKAKTTQGIEVSDERWQEFAGIYTEVVKSVYGDYCNNISDYDEKGFNAHTFR